MEIRETPSCAIQGIGFHGVYRRRKADKHEKMKETWDARRQKEREISLLD